MNDEDEYRTNRKRLVEHLRLVGIEDEGVLQAILHTPRHLFLKKELWDSAYEDTPLPIACEQTISQPYIVASMTSTLCQGKQLSSVLEVGTGTGYQAAVLSQFAGKVYSIERVEALARESKERLKTLGYTNVEVKFGDGYLGWPEYAPFEGIIVTAAAPAIPQALLDQLKEGGRLVMPVGELGDQYLILITRQGNQFQKTLLEGVRFVPLLPGVR